MGFSRPDAPLKVSRENSCHREENDSSQKIQGDTSNMCRQVKVSAFLEINLKGRDPDLRLGQQRFANSDAEAVQQEDFDKRSSNQVHRMWKTLGAKKKAASPK